MNLSNLTTAEFRTQASQTHRFSASAGVGREEIGTLPEIQYSGKFASVG